MTQINKVVTDFQCRDKDSNTRKRSLSQHQNEAATRNQVKWRQNSVATNFLGRDRNSENTRNNVSIRTKVEMLLRHKNLVATPI